MNKSRYRALWCQECPSMMRISSDKNYYLGPLSHMNKATSLYQIINVFLIFMDHYNINGLIEKTIPFPLCSWPVVQYISCDFDPIFNIENMYQSPKVIAQVELFWNVTFRFELLYDPWMENPH